MRARGEEEERPSRLTNTRLVYFCTVICMWRYRALWYNEGTNNGKTFQGTGDRESAPSVHQLKYQSDRIVVLLFCARLGSGDSSVGIATRYGNGRSGDRIPVRSKFPASIQIGSKAHPASYTISTGSFPGVKRPGCGVDHLPPSSAEVKERVELYLYSHSGPS